MKGLIVALQFMTRLPMPQVETSGEDFAHSMRWFPAVGLVVGLVIAGISYPAAMLGPWIGAVAGLASWVMVTGGLHLDGLADLVDARGAEHGDRTRFLEVLADPHIGSFGVMAIGLQLIAKLVLLEALIAQQHWLSLIFVPFAARLGPLIWARQLPPLHKGLGARFSNVVGLSHILIWLLALAGAALLLPALWFAPVLALAGSHWFRTRVGGISGDCHGAGIELSETALLCLALVLSGF